MLVEDLHYPSRERRSFFYRCLYLEFAEKVWVGSGSKTEE
jgi:hypothetical protein